MPEPEQFTLSSALRVWKRYDPAVKAELWSTAVSHRDTTVLIDPTDHNIAAATAVVVTNENHLRDGPSIAARLMVPLYAHPDVAAQIGGHAVAAGASIASLLSVIEIDGAPLGEIALLDTRDAGTLIVGDALVNFEPHGFTLLPAKYCRNQKQMRKSLRQLLDLRFQRLLFAHGTPIAANAPERLAALLEV